MTISTLRTTRNARNEEEGFSTLAVVITIIAAIAVLGGILHTGHKAISLNEDMTAKYAMVSIGDKVMGWQAANPSLDAVQEGALSTQEGFSPREGYSYTLQRYEAETGQFCMQVSREGSSPLLYNSDKRGVWNDCLFVSDYGAERGTVIASVEGSSLLN